MKDSHYTLTVVMNSVIFHLRIKQINYLINLDDLLILYSNMEFIIETDYAMSGHAATISLSQF